MTNLVSSDDAVKELKRLQGDLTQSAFAAVLGVSPGYLSEIYRGTRTIGPTIAKFLQLEQEVWFRRTA